MKRLSEQFTRSFASINKLSRAFQPKIANWATEQQQAMAALSKIFAAPRLGALGAVSMPTRSRADDALGLTASVRKEMFPTLQTMSAFQLAATPSVGLLAQRIRLPNTIAGNLSKSLKPLSRDLQHADDAPGTSSTGPAPHGNDQRCTPCGRGSGGLGRSTGRVGGSP